MRRVLIITYYWPPAGGSGVQRWVKFSRELPGLGWQPVIYTPENPEMTSTDESLLAEIPSEAEIVRTRIIEPYGLYRRLFGKKGGGTAGEVNPINSQKKSFKQKLALFVRGNMFVPDPRIWWVGPSVRFLKKYLKEHPVDAVVSTGPPHSMHLIARRVAGAAGIPWVADFRDPWTRMFYFKNLPLTSFSRRRHLSLEQKVLDDASAVIAVTPFVQEDFRRCTDTPVAMITNGFDERDFEQEIVRDGNFNITHTGLFASDGIPDVLWKVLAEKCAVEPEFREKLRVRLVGKTDREVLASLENAGLAANVVNLGYLDHRDAVREQMSASMLILPLRKDPEYRKTLPGKVFEYMASRRPVLGIGQEDGVMAQVLAETGSGSVCDWENAAGMKAFIDKEWEKFIAGEWDFHVSGLEKYTRRATASQLAALLEELTGK